ncbi:MAG: DUF1294 domain-containing protein [Bacilli bacterium]
MIQYLITINIISYLLCYIDKKKSIKNKWRISENTLLFTSLIGGSLGMILSMTIHRHKTKKLKFKIIVPLLLVLWITMILYYKFGEMQR